MATPINLSTMTGTGSSLSLNGKNFAVGVQTSLSQLKSVSDLAKVSGVSIRGEVVTISKAGLVLDGYDLRNSNVVVTGSNVTIKNSLFNTKTGYSTVYQEAGASGLTVENCTFDGQKSGGADTVVNSNSGAMTVRGNEFFNIPSDGVNIQSGTVEHNYFSGSGYEPGAHADAISVQSSTGPVTIRENYIDFVKTPGAAAEPNAALKIVQEWDTPVHDVTVEGNVLLGGGYSIYANGTAMNNVRIANNDIGLSNWGDLFPGNHGSNFVWLNNHSFSSGKLSASGSTSSYTPSPSPSPSSSSASPVKAVAPGQSAGFPAGSPATPATPKAHYVQGSEATDIIFGTAGKDAIVLKGGFDICLAGAGDDAIYGGFGRDLMASQAGNDRFVYKSVLDSHPGAAQRDCIVDWSAGHDRIDLRAIDADLQQSGNQAFSWIGSKSFSGSGAEVRSYFDGRSTIVEADVNGDRQADLQIELWGKHTMTISDFLL